MCLPWVTLLHIGEWCLRTFYDRFGSMPFQTECRWLTMSPLRQIKYPIQHFRYLWALPFVKSYTRMLVIRMCRPHTCSGSLVHRDYYSALVETTSLRGFYIEWIQDCDRFFRGPEPFQTNSVLGSRSFLFFCYLLDRIVEDMLILIKFLSTALFCLSWNVFSPYARKTV